MDTLNFYYVFLQQKMKKKVMLESITALQYFLEDHVMSYSNIQEITRDSPSTNKTLACQQGSILVGSYSHRLKGAMKDFISKEKWSKIEKRQFIY